MAEAVLPRGDAANPFRLKTVLLLVATGLIAFAGFLIFTAYAPEWKMKGDGGMHAMSKSAVGYSGLYALEEALNGDDVYTVENREDWYTKGLLIVTLSPQTNVHALTDLVRIRRSSQMKDATTLYILPKWAVAPLPTKSGWVMKGGTIPPIYVQDLLTSIGHVPLAGDSAKVPQTRLIDTDYGGCHAPLRPIQTTTASPRVIGPAPVALRTLKSPDVYPVVSDSKGRTVLGRLNCNSYILADPDLMANHGIKSAGNAAAAVALIEAMRPSADSEIAFDMVLPGIGETRNLLRLMFEPPFLAFTLALVAAAILIGLHGLGRFGPPLAEGRAIAFGKAALADNAASLIARAGRERALGDRYVAVVRDAAGAALGARHKTPEDLEAWLDTLPGGFGALAQAARTAPDAATMRDAAAALHNWKKDITRDH